ncbi:EpsD family peptidyl-prolyl cis-trans isomerase [Glaciimonas immobilis]|uniref:peptidylprolyl isomerase n=2 Tax=Glaciimonas immobilis TaxID=728004 RepID=A0A840RZU8_9BURK|nr:peptidyl-prolyl cis-trans isomerase, EpsD family [Glaciimonas immobilis]MBB5202011.1 EpsD family peptidyl-prolyl cis-trans isomerase [Glaciimonas immobilis]
MMIPKLLILMVSFFVLSLTGCSDRNKNTSKILLWVNGDEITTRQLDAELVRSSSAPGSNPEDPPNIRKQALEGLVDRKILLQEAKRKKMDRDPKVIQLIEIYKTYAIVQAYLETLAGTTGSPSQKNVGDYIHGNEKLFLRRKMLDINQLSIASREFSSQLKAVMDAGKSLDEVEAWLIGRKIAYVRIAASYDSADLPDDVFSQLQNIGTNHLFVIEEGDRDLLSVVTNMADGTLRSVQQNLQIERFLMDKKMQEVAAIEIARLRLLAKIEYVEKSDSGHIEGELHPVMRNKL